MKLRTAVMSLMLGASPACGAACARSACSPAAAAALAHHPTILPPSLFLLLVPRLSVLLSSRHLNKFCKLRITVALAYANNFAFINRLSNAAVIFAFKLKVVPMPHTPLSSKGRTTVPRSRTFIPLLLPIQQPVS